LCSGEHEQKQERDNFRDKKQLLVSFLLGRWTWKGKGGGELWRKSFLVEIVAREEWEGEIAREVEGKWKI
jgi:hypothetical protein